MTLYRQAINSARIDPEVGNDPMLKAAKAASEAFPFYTIKQAAKVLGVEVRTVRRWQAARRMPPQKKHGRRKIYSKDAIDAMIVARTGTSQP